MGTREKGGVEEMTRTDWQQGQEKGVWRLCPGMWQRYQKMKSPTENKVHIDVSSPNSRELEDLNTIISWLNFSSPSTIRPVIAEVLLVSGCSITFQVAPLWGFSQTYTIRSLATPCCRQLSEHQQNSNPHSQVALRSTQIPYLTLFLILHFVFFVSEIKSHIAQAVLKLVSSRE